MNASLPTVEELEKLPMRAIAAYAGRTARRLSPALRGVVPDQILDDLLRLIDDVSTTSDIVELKQAVIADAVQRLTEAYATEPASMKSPEKFLVVFSLVHAALASISVIRAVVDPASSRRESESAAREAHRALREARNHGDGLVRAAVEAAIKDYDVLVRVYGEHGEVIIGEPVNCFDNVF